MGQQAVGTEAGQHVALGERGEGAERADPQPYQQPGYEQPQYQQEYQQGYQQPGYAQPVYAQGQPGAPYGIHPGTGIPYSDKQKLVAGRLAIGVSPEGGRGFWIALDWHINYSFGRVDRTFHYRHINLFDFALRKLFFSKTANARGRTSPANPCTNCKCVFSPK